MCQFEKVKVLVKGKVKEVERLKNCGDESCITKQKCTTPNGNILRGIKKKTANTILNLRTLELNDKPNYQKDLSVSSLDTRSIASENITSTKSTTPPKRLSSTSRSFNLDSYSDGQVFLL